MPTIPQVSYAPIFDGLNALERATSLDFQTKRFQLNQKYQTANNILAIGQAAVGIAQAGMSMYEQYEMQKVQQAKLDAQNRLSELNVQNIETGDFENWGTRFEEYKTELMNEYLGDNSPFKMQSARNEMQSFINSELNPQWESAVRQAMPAIFKERAEVFEVGLTENLMADVQEQYAMNEQIIVLSKQQASIQSVKGWESNPEAAKLNDQVAEQINYLQAQIGTAKNARTWIAGSIKEKNDGIGLYKAYQEEGLGEIADGALKKKLAQYTAQKLVEQDNFNDANTYLSDQQGLFTKTDYETEQANITDARNRFAVANTTSWDQRLFRPQVWENYNGIKNLKNEFLSEGNKEAMYWKQKDSPSYEDELKKMTARENQLEEELKKDSTKAQGVDMAAEYYSQLTQNKITIKEYLRNITGLAQLPAKDSKYIGGEARTKWVNMGLEYKTPQAKEAIANTDDLFSALKKKEKPGTAAYYRIENSGQYVKDQLLDFILSEPDATTEQLKKKAESLRSVALAKEIDGLMNRGFAPGYLSKTEDQQLLDYQRKLESGELDEAFNYDRTDKLNVAPGYRERFEQHNALLDKKFAETTGSKDFIPVTNEDGTRSYYVLQRDKSYKMYQFGSTDEKGKEKLTLYDLNSNSKVTTPAEKKMVADTVNGTFTLQKMIDSNASLKDIDKKREELQKIYDSKESKETLSKEMRKALAQALIRANKAVQAHQYTESMSVGTL